MCNLTAGFMLSIFRNVEKRYFHTGIDQVVLLVFTLSVLTFIITLFTSLPEPEFSLMGLADVASQVSFIMLASYILSKLLKQEPDLIMVILLSIWPWLYLTWAFFGEGENFNSWLFSGNKKILYIVYITYFFAAVCAAIIRLDYKKIKYYILVPIVCLVGIFIPLHYIYTGQFWHLAYDYDDKLSSYKNINQEDTYYKQFEFMADLKNTLLPTRKDKTDLYFVGFGSYAYEDVFMKEISYIKELFDNRFNTKGRSVALINNYKTVDEVPIASRTNLGMVLRTFSNVMDKENDIVFIYLTSHGSDKNYLSVNLEPLRLNSIRPGDLKFYLDYVGIKNRIILVSACYSGGFIEPLKDEFSVIMTASSSDRTSFGCGSKSEFTYFGHAIFREQLNQKFNFITAFQDAIAAINEREKLEKLKSSQPQLYVGSQIGLKLEKLGQDLEGTFNSNKNEKLVESEKSMPLNKK